MARIVLITGGNLGPVAENLTAARLSVEKSVGKVVCRSSMIASDAWGFEAPERFLNQVLVVETELAPEEALDRCQQIEREMGRRRIPGAGYRSRTMDIDILFYDRRIVRTERLTIPHPLIAERDFVLAPLEEVLPDFVHPVLGKTVRELRALLADRQPRKER